ncbi:hypothetical protein ABTA54_19885, partial [Acinetobacter baumannii]
QSIAAKLNPKADAETLTREAAKLQKMNEGNGYKGLHTGLILNTEDPYALDRQTRKAVAEHFGLPAPKEFIPKTEPSKTAAKT